MCQTGCRKCTTKIKESGMFSILAEEAVDIPNVEQMPVAIRYVDISNSRSNKEQCLCMAKCKEGVSGYGISKTISSTVKDKLNLDMKSCNGKFTKIITLIYPCVRIRI